MLRVRELEVVYPNGTRALERTSLSFWPGVFTVLLGASGAGKSTLLRSLNGLVVPSAGTVEAEGLGNIADRRTLRQHRRATGMVFQQHQLIGRLTVLENVMTGRLGYHTALRTLFPLPAAGRYAALDALERVDLADYALRRADELSGGQQQRVGIARSLVQKPSLILADEPVASLDPATSLRVLGFLHEICKADRIGAVVSLHQLDFARRFADRIVGLARGRVVFDGPPAALGRAEIASIYGDIAPAAVALGDESLPPRKTGTYA
jgi:phosphonate transport system ATP-binding protein